MSRGKGLGGKECDFDGCDRDAKSRGSNVFGVWCGGHYQQQYSGSEMSPIRVLTLSESLAEKTCKTCVKTKPVSEFYRSRSTWQPECKECLKARSSARYRSVERANGVIRRPYSPRASKEAA